MVLRFVLSLYSREGSEWKCSIDTKQCDKSKATFCASLSSFGEIASVVEVLQHNRGVGIMFFWLNWMLFMDF